MITTERSSPFAAACCCMRISFTRRLPGLIFKPAQSVMQTFGLPLRYYVDNLRVFRFIQSRDSVWRKHVLVTDDVDPQWRSCLRTLESEDVTYALSPRARRRGKVRTSVPLVTRSDRSNLCLGKTHRLGGCPRGAPTRVPTLQLPPSPFHHWRDPEPYASITPNAMAIAFSACSRSRNHTPHPKMFSVCAKLARWTATAKSLSSTTTFLSLTSTLRRCRAPYNSGCHPTSPRSPHLVERPHGAFRRPAPGRFSSSLLNFTTVHFSTSPNRVSPKNQQRQSCKESKTELGVGNNLPIPIQNRTQTTKSNLSNSNQSRSR